MALPRGLLDRLGAYALAGIVNGQRHPTIGADVVADGDRRATMLDRVGERLLRDAEDGELDGGGRSRLIGALERLTAQT
jgi:hypothetical protein